MPRYSDEWWPPPSRPRKAKGGIRARTSRGGFGESWWARRWIQVLESFPIGGRLQRGRSYARTGQVLSIEISAGAVTASVQGSRARPYRVSIRVPVHAAEAWRAASARLIAEARYAAAVLAGDLPTDLEERLREGGLALFPSTPADLETDCSCPDWSNPCKHVAAVCYLVAEELDRDPFLLFTLRGLDRRGMADLFTRAEDRDGDAAPPADQELALPVDPDEFWGGPATPTPARETAVPDTNAALVHLLGPFPFWQGETPPAAAFETFYRRASELGLDLVAGDTG